MADDKQESKQEERSDSKELEYTEAPSRGVFLAPYGNRTGNQIEDAIRPAGVYVGGLVGALGGPVGGIIDPILGGVFRGGAAYGEVAGVGAGNMDKKNEQADIDARTPLGGKKQDGQNPLGL